MKTSLRYVFAASALAMAAQVMAQVTFYEHEGFGGRTFTTDKQVSNFAQFGFNDRSSSAVVSRGRWEACEDAQFGGRCVVLRPGRYPSLTALGLNDSISSVRMVARDVRVDDNRYAPAPAAPQIVFYEREGFEGRSFNTDKQVGNFERNGFNDRASSVVVTSDLWEACEDPWFGGRCVVLRPGRYPSLAAMGLNDSVTSVRTVSANERIDDNRYAPAPIPAPAVAQITFYERESFEGRSFTTNDQIGNLERDGFNDRASSAVVVGEPREVCDDIRFNGRCVVLRPGRYRSLAAMGLNDRISSVRSVNVNALLDDRRYVPRVLPAPPLPPSVAAQVTLYEWEGFEGRSFATREQIDNLERFGFNDRASSVVIIGDPQEICDDVRFNGRCVVLRPGRYPSLAAMGLNDRISSVRAVRPGTRVDDNRYVPAPVAVYDYRRRDNERLFEAQVTSVRAVVESGEQRCWVEREQVAPDQTNANVPGAIVGAIIGGILGHQIGGGRGKDAATAGGAIAGAAVGANVGRDGSAQQVYTQDVQRCAGVPRQARTAYWDVTYVFRGEEHRLQMSTPPGSTITVNGQGEPRA